MRSGQYLGIKFILGITSYSWWCRCVCVCVWWDVVVGGGGGGAVITNVIYLIPSISSENKLLTRSKHCIAMTVITVTLCNSVALCNNYFEICETLFKKTQKE